MTLPAWLARAVFYQIYPQSFYDANGDGVGDLAGIEAKLDYLADLGVNALWINPCFVSPFKDAGYDVADYCRIAPRYGTNESSSRCSRRRTRATFASVSTSSRATRRTSIRGSSNPAARKRNEYTDRYVWTNNPWVTRDEELNFISGTSDRAGAYAIEFFRASAGVELWVRRADAQLSAGHRCAGPTATRAALMQTMKFWLDLGVDGFRVDLAGSIVKRDPQRIGVRRVWREVRAWLDANYRDRVLISEWGNPELAIDAGFHADFMQHVGVPGYDALMLGPESFPQRRELPYFDSRGAGDFRRFLKVIRISARPRCAARADRPAVVEPRLRAAPPPSRCSTI